MIVVVNKIIIKQVTVLADEIEKYKVRINWELVTGQNMPYVGDLWAIVYKNNVPTVTELDYTKGMTNAEVELALPDLNATYFIALTADPKNYTDCTREQILLLTYDNISCFYEDSIMEISWDAAHKRIANGNLVIKAGGESRYIEVEGIELKKRIAINILDYGDTSLELVMTPKVSKISFGPESEKLIMQAAPVEIISAEVMKNDGDGRAVTVKFYLSDQAYLQKSNIKVIASLFKNGKKVYTSESKALTDESEKVIDITFSVDGNIAHNIHSHELVLYLSCTNGRANNFVTTKSNAISLGVPSVQFQYGRFGKQLSANWDYDNEYLTGFKLYIDNIFDKEVSEGKYTWSDSSTIIDKNIQIAPVYDNKTGPKSNAAVPFTQGYYPQGKGVWKLAHKSYAQTVTEIDLTGNIFGITLDEPVAESPLSILQTGINTYRLQIQNIRLTGTVFLTWFNKLFEKDLTPYGYYLLRDKISRAALYHQEDALLITSGMDTTKKLWADIMPGHILRIETANYMKQPEKGMSDIEGYVSSGIREYSVSFKQTDTGGRLEADSFVENVLGAWSRGDVSSEQVIIEATGIIDFFRTQMKMPYYALHYPASFYKSDDAGTMYCSDNVYILAANTIADILEAKKHPAAPGIPCLIFRGRSAVTIRIAIFVNGARETVPIGTTLNNILWGCGIMGSAAGNPNVRMSRQTGIDGQPPAEMRLNWLEPNDEYDIYLLPGDRIEV